MTVSGHTLYFTYDAAGAPLSVTYDGTTYYYLTNLQGDVIAILNGTAETVVTYRYDAWGNILDTDGTMKDTLGLHNPLRYRGYVYDTETRLYYLQSRYYNPEWGRFISADNIDYLGADGTPLSYNLFTYCKNNPVMGYDTSGYFGIGILCLIGAFLSATIDYAAQVISNYNNGLSGVDAWTDVNIGSIVSSAFSGAISSIPGGGTIAFLVDATMSAAIEHGVNALITGTNISFYEVRNDVYTNLFTGLFIPDSVNKKIPKHIRDIKDEAVEQGIKGTRKLQEYLDFRQVSGIVINAFNNDTASRLVDWVL